MNLNKVRLNRKSLSCATELLTNPLETSPYNVVLSQSWFELAQRLFSSPETGSGDVVQLDIPLEILAYIYEQHEDSDTAIIQINNLDKFVGKILSGTCGNSFLKEVPEAMSRVY
jgi:hypothetical protein